ncbi:MAG TPA: hypothetical protein PLR83_07705 [Pyrinomonadaceae bacterium]|nr:hypothetical protein [Pyrinomonadaceae bacterium]
MKIRTSLFRPLAVCIAVIFIASSGFGQTISEKPGESFNFVLQLVAAGQGSGVKDGLPIGWEKVEKQLRSTFSVKGFETVGTFAIRGTIGGTVGYEGRWSGPSKDTARVSVARYSLSDLSLDEGKIVTKDVNFFLAIPPSLDFQQPASVRDHQVFKVTMSSLAFEPNSPTVLGAFQIAGIDGPVFAVLTAKSQ